MTNLDDGIDLADRSRQVGRVLTVPAHGEPTDIAVAGGVDVIVGTARAQRDGVRRVRLGPDAIRHPAAGAGSSAPLRSRAALAGSGSPTPDRRIVGRLDLRRQARQHASCRFRPTNELAVAYFFDGLAVGEGAIWVAGDPRAEPVAHRPRHREAGRSDPAPIRPEGRRGRRRGGLGDGQLDDTVSRIDPATNRVTATIRVGRGAAGVAVGRGFGLGRERGRRHGLSNRPATTLR